MLLQFQYPQTPSHLSRRRTISTIHMWIGRLQVILCSLILLAKRQHAHDALLRWGTSVIDDNVLGLGLAASQAAAEAAQQAQPDDDQYGDEDEFADTLEERLFLANLFTVFIGMAF